MLTQNGPVRMKIIIAAKFFWVYYYDRHPN